MLTAHRVYDLRQMAERGGETAKAKYAAAKADLTEKCREVSRALAMWRRPIEVWEMHTINGAIIEAASEMARQEFYDDFRPEWDEFTVIYWLGHKKRGEIIALAREWLRNSTDSDDLEFKWENYQLKHAHYDEEEDDYDDDDD